MPRWLRWSLLLSPVVIVFVGLPLSVVFWDDFNSWERRFPFPADQQLTETVALDYSRRAFMQTRIKLTDATPVPFYPSRTNVFLFNADSTTVGVLMGRVPSMATERGMEKAGDQLIVTLGKHWL